MMTEQEKWEFEYKDEIIKDLQAALRGDIKAEGGYNPLEGKWEINYSSILTKLIQEAGRWCDDYASDLFIRWEGIKEKLDDGSMSSESYVFGFRESGVDGNSWYEEHKTDEDYYRAVWFLDITENKGKLEMFLHK
jgi:hypothetical protein